MQEEHDRHDHGCTAEKCMYYPKLGPSGNFTSSLCMCQCCLEEDRVSLYCSRECYEENFVSLFSFLLSCPSINRANLKAGSNTKQSDHQEQAFDRRGLHNHYEELEYFRPAEDMQILS